MNIRNITTLVVCFCFVGISQGRQLASDSFDKSYRKGVELFRAEQYRAAEEEFLKVRRLITPERSIYAEEIDYYLTASEARRGSDGAEAAIARFFGEYPNSLHRNELSLVLGDMYLSSKEYEKALAQYEKIDEKSLSADMYRELSFNRGYARFYLGDHGKAYEDMNKVGNDKVYGSSATYYKAYIDYSAGELDKAESGFRSIASDRNFREVVPFYLLQIDFRRGEYREVVASADQLIERSDGERRNELLKITGESYYHLEDWGNASKYLNTYADQVAAPGREESYLIGICSYMNGDFTRAAEFLGKAADGDDVLAQNAAFHIGNSYLRAENKQRAQQAFAVAMKMDWDSGIKQEAMFNFAKLQYELGGNLFNETIGTVNAYLAEFPDSPNADEARKYLLAAYMNTRNYSAAYEAISKVRNPDQQTKAALQRVAYYRGLEYFTDSDWNNAQKMFETASANRYNAKINALSRYWMAETFYRKGEYARAIPLYQDYIVLSPKEERENAMANYNLAYCYFNTKNVREARLWFERFIAQYTPADEIKADAYNRLGDMYFISREYTKAIAEYDHSAATGTGSGDYARFRKAVALGLTSGSAAKIEALKAITAKGTGEYADDAMYELGATYTRTENFDLAAQTLEAFMKRYPSSEHYPAALTDLGLIYQNTGKEEQAMGYYKAVVEKFPNTPQSKSAMLGLRNIYMDKGDIAGYYDFAKAFNIETDAGIVQRDSLTFAVAEKIYLTGDVKRARPLLETYLSQFSSGAYSTNATYYIADCDMQEGRIDEALAGYEKIASMASGQFSANSLYNAGSINYNKGNYLKASAMFKKFTDQYPGNPLAGEALVGYVRAVNRLNDPAAAIEAADYAINYEGATKEVVTEAGYIKGVALYGISERDKALPLLREVASNMRSAAGAHSQYLVIRILFEESKTEEAEKEVFRFSESGTTQQLWLGKAFLTLGEIYLLRNDIFQAKATYQSIVDGYTDKEDGVIAEATAKLNALK